MSQRCLDFNQNVASRSKEPPCNNNGRRMPAGIGLHLNSLGAFPTKTENSCENSKPQAEWSSADDSGVFTVDEGILLDEYPSINLPNTARKRLSSDSETTEPKSKRRRKNEGSCKRCSCKKSRCLKLYCECFASGTYCMDSCVCRDCSNKPEFEATVNEVRSQIKSRNPLAFEPRVIPTEDVETPEGPASKHKKGCNCKKSMCLKKYCECYQSEVGCSISCKCVGCKNTFGAKQGGEEFATPGSSKAGHSFVVESPASPALLRAICAMNSDGLVYNEVSGKDTDSSPVEPASTCSKTSSNFHTFGTPLYGGNFQFSPESRTGTPEPASLRRVDFLRRCSPSAKPLSPGIHSLQSKVLYTDSPNASPGTDGNIPDILRDQASEGQSQAVTTTTTTTSSPKKKRVQVVKSMMKLPPVIKNGRKLTLQALPSLPSVSSLRENFLRPPSMDNPQPEM